MCAQGQRDMQRAKCFNNKAGATPVPLKAIQGALCEDTSHTC